jgi:RimJ/RimL family protein N-acetyltransferase
MGGRGSVSIRLSGDRVELRPFSNGDVEVLWAEERLGRGPLSVDEERQLREQLERRCETSGTWHRGSSLILAIEARGTLVGELQLRRSDDVFPPGLFELGISLFRSVRGQGLGSETLRIVARYLFDEEHAGRIQLGTDVDNVAMRRAAEKAGFAFEGVMRGFWPAPEEDAHDYALYARTRADHEAGATH